MFMFWKNKSQHNELAKWGIGAGIAEILYVFLVVLFFMYVPNLIPQADSILMPLFMLLLFVLSAGISGLLVFGRPAYLFLQKQYTPAIWTLLSTLLTIFIGAVIVLVVIFINY